jgi:hypothetical protein
MAFSKSRPVTVVVPARLKINQVHEITEKTLGILGCGECHSGFDIRILQHEIIVFDKALDAKVVNGARVG